MNVTVYSRSEIEEIIEKGQFPENTAVISFYDPKIKILALFLSIAYRAVCSIIFVPDIAYQKLCFYNTPDISLEK